MAKYNFARARKMSFKMLVNHYTRFYDKSENGNICNICQFIKKNLVGLSPLFNKGRNGL